MSPRLLADLAVILARHAEALGGDRGPDAAALSHVERLADHYFRQGHDELLSAATPGLYAVLFAAELPLRVWCTAVALPRWAASVPPEAEELFGKLLDLRCLALRALAADHALTSREAASLDRFRRRSERWNDVLLGTLLGRTGRIEYAFQPDRANEFAESSGSDDGGRRTWPLIAAGMRLTFASADREYRTSASRIATELSPLAAALLACFPRSAFDGDGRLLAVHLARSGRIVNESPPAATVPRPVSRPSALLPPPSTRDAPKPATGISFASLRKRRPVD